MSSTSSQLTALVASLDTECLTQVSCRRARNDLLKIKKLTDILRKEHLKKSQDLKLNRPEKVEKVAKAPKVPKVPKAPKVSKAPTTATEATQTMETAEIMLSMGEEPRPQE
jgi:hypothetical protein